MVSMRVMYRYRLRIGGGGFMADPNVSVDKGRVTYMFTESVA